MKIKYALVAQCALASLVQTIAVAQSPGDMASLTLTFRYLGEHIGKKEFKDRTTYDQSATIVCPIVAGDPTSVSSIHGATKEESDSFKKQEDAATRRMKGVSPSSVDRMKSLEKKMKECRSAGGSEQICGMQMMMAMQGDPSLVEGMGEDEPIEGLPDRYQPWFNEGCSGTMTVNNTFQLDDPTIPGPEPVIHTRGTQKIETRDTLVTIETDLEKKQTTLMIVAPQGVFDRDASWGEKPTKETLSAIPENPLLAGPYPGPLQSGRFEKKLTGGGFTVEWSFARAK